MSNEAAFENARKKVIESERQRIGIGTLSEKTVHAILKNYYEPDEDYQEIPIENYVADIYRDGKIVEIQTRQLGKLREKLTVFLPLYQVTVVYPIPREKWVIWIDEESGALSRRNKSPKKGNPYLAFPELYQIKMFLKDPNLKVRLALLDMEEYRLLNGWSRDKKRGSSRYDRIPLRLAEEVEIDCPQDYMQFVPCDLERAFTSEEFAKAAHISTPLAREVLNILYHVGTLTRVGKKKNQYLYEVLEV